MATAVRSQMTLMELARRTNQGDIITIAEVLAETNEVLEDAVWVESNQPTSHVTTQRTSLPSGTWRKINGGVSREASSTRQIVEGMGNLEAYSVVDLFLYNIAPNPDAFRSGEDKAFLEGMNQRFADCLFRDDNSAGAPYGSTAAHPERFNGFPVRTNDDKDLNNVHDNGDSSATNDTSVWVIQWGEQMCHLIYPRGSKMGITHTDLGECTVSASDSPSSSPSEYQALRSHFQLTVGLVVRDDRCWQRVCNIDSVQGQTYSFNDDMLITAINALPYKGRNAVIYANQQIKTMMDIMAKDKGNVNWSTVEVFGRPTTVFFGVPVRRVDAITNTEASLT